MSSYFHLNATGIHHENLVFDGFLGNWIQSGSLLDTVNILLDTVNIRMQKSLVCEIVDNRPVWANQRWDGS
jgi:hypothetical protein